MDGKVDSSGCCGVVLCWVLVFVCWVWGIIQEMVEDAGVVGRMVRLLF